MDADIINMQPTKRLFFSLIDSRLSTSFVPPGLLYHVSCIMYPAPFDALLVFIHVYDSCTYVCSTWYGTT